MNITCTSYFYPFVVRLKQTLHVTLENDKFCKLDHNTLLLVIKAVYMYLYQCIIISNYYISLGIKEMTFIYETNGFMQSIVLLLPRYLPRKSANEYNKGYK